MKASSLLENKGISFPVGSGVGRRGGKEERVCSPAAHMLPGSVPETDNSCKVCCRDPSGRCVPYVDAEQKNLFLRKGKPCTVGFCDMNVSIYFHTAFSVTARRAVLIP